MSTKTEQFEVAKPKDAKAWKQAGVHDVVLPSGVQVQLRIPNLPMLAKTGQIPNDLISAAIGAMQGDVEITPEIVNEQADFYNKLVTIAVVEPKLTEQDVSGDPDDPEDDGLPYEDIELIIEIATRQRDVDALGRHIAGLHLSSEWRSFRAKLSGNAALEDI